MQIRKWRYRFQIFCKLILEVLECQDGKRLYQKVTSFSSLLPIFYFLFDNLTSIAHGLVHYFAIRRHHHNIRSEHRRPSAPRWAQTQDFNCRCRILSPWPLTIRLLPSFHRSIYMQAWLINDKYLLNNAKTNKTNR